MASTYTTHYNLEKPDGNDDINVNAINSDFDKIDAAMWNLAMASAYSAGQTNLSETLKSCTGTIADHVKYHMAGNFILIEGRLLINDYVRTGGNPGFTFSLPNGRAAKKSFNISNVGNSGTTNVPFRFGEITRIYGSANSGIITVDTTETIENMSSASKAVFMVYPIIIELA